jgi:hypothetical protein
LLDGERNGAGDGVGADGDPAELPHAFGCCGIRDGVGQFRFRHAGRNYRHTDVVILLAQAFRDRDHGEFRRAVDSAGRIYRMSADGRDIDELAVALFLHDRQSGGDAMQHATDVDINHLIPFVHFERFQRRKRHDAGVVDDDVHLAEFALRKIDEGFDVFALRDVERPIPRRTAFGADGGNQRFEPVRAPRAQDYVRALLRQQARRRLSDSATRPGDCNDFSLASLNFAFLEPEIGSQMRKIRLLLSRITT